MATMGDAERHIFSPLDPKWRPSEYPNASVLGPEGRSGPPTRSSKLHAVLHGKRTAPGGHSVAGGLTPFVVTLGPVLFHLCLFGPVLGHLEE